MIQLGLIELALIAAVVWLVVRKRNGERIGAPLAMFGVVAATLALAPGLGLLVARATMLSAEAATAAQRAVSGSAPAAGSGVVAVLPLLALVLVVLLVLSVIRIARQGSLGALALFMALVAVGAGLFGLAVYRGAAFVPPPVVVELQPFPPGVPAHPAPPRVVGASLPPLEPAGEPRIDLGYGPWDAETNQRELPWEPAAKHDAHSQADYDAERVHANDEAYGPGGAEAKRVEFLGEAQSNLDGQRRAALAEGIEQARSEWQAAQQSASDAAKQATSEFKRITKEFQRLAGLVPAGASEPRSVAESATEALAAALAPATPVGPEAPAGPEEPRLPTGDESPAAKPAAGRRVPEWVWVNNPPKPDGRTRREVLVTDPFFTPESLDVAADAQLRSWVEEALAKSLGRERAAGALAGVPAADLRETFVATSHDETRDSMAGEAMIRHQLVELPEVIPARFLDSVQRHGQRERVAGVAAIGGSVVGTIALLYGLLGIGGCKR
ncbi:MAG: hypothetical protein ACRCT8_07110 [Lacipirellulaceae bacterium]